MAVSQVDEGMKFLHHAFSVTHRLAVLSIRILAYDPDCPFQYNNFLYDVTLNNPGHYRESVEPCHAQSCSKLPDGVFRAVARIPNAAANGLQQDNRVGSEVAAMTLARQALRSCSMAHLIPEVYLWTSPAEGEQGWMLMEHKSGVPLAETLPDADGENKKGILAQLAAVFAALQAFEVPSSINGFGGLSYGTDGRIGSGGMTTMPIAGVRTYDGFIRTRTAFQLETAKRIGGENGWIDDGIVRGVQSVLNDTLPKIMAMGDGFATRTLVHGDFSLSNVLIDQSTLTLTALLDFDFAYVGSKLDDFFLSMRELGAQLPGPAAADNDGGVKATREAMLTSVWGTHPASASRPAEDAALWYQVLKQAGALTPDMVAGVRELSAIWELSELLCPYMLCEPVVVAGRTPEQRTRDAEVAKQAIYEALDQLDAR